MTTSDPTDFGEDLSCMNDLDEAMAEVSGITVLAQAIYRRLYTPRGALWQDPDYGLDLRNYLSKGLTQDVIRGIPGDVQGEILKDQRVETATVTILSYGTFTLSIAIACETGAGPFTLVLDATQAAVVLAAITSTAPGTPMLNISAATVVTT